MKNNLRKLLLLLGLAPLALAQQNTFTSTTIAVAILPPGTAGGQQLVPVCFTVASTTGINGPNLTNNGPFGGSQSTIGSILLIDSEAIQVQSVNSVTDTVCGWRGYDGTRVEGHLAGALAWIGNPDWYSSAPAGTHPAGSCTIATTYAYPDIHLVDGTWYACSDNSYWAFAGPGTATLGAPKMYHSVTTTYTAKFYDYVVAVNTSSAAFTVTLPAASSVPGKEFIFTDVGGDAGTNHLTVSTTTPSGCASLSANGATSRVISNGSAWVCE